MSVDHHFMSLQHILQVSEFTKKVRFLLESELNTVWLTGEISNFIAASSGHWYLSLKDSRSQVRCAMFKGSNRRVRFSERNLPNNGQQVLIRAKVSLYEPRGDFQLIIEHMEDAGEGILRQQFERLKSKLNLQGLFDQQHKKAISSQISCVGIITSPTGAAVKDILTVLKRRNPNINVIIYPALVQGEQAKEAICQAINIANERDECDVLIVGRGGGSLEDLWAFNEEDVVRAIYQSALPIISAVGHEIDTTLSDYVADLRAPTPSAAAELVSCDSNELMDRMNMHKQQLINAVKRKYVELSQHKESLQHRLAQVHPKQQLLVQQQKQDELDLRLKDVMCRLIKEKKTEPQQLQQRLYLLSPQNNIDTQRNNMEDKKQRLIKTIHNNLSYNKDNFVNVIEQLQLVSPLATIARGYSVTRNEKGEVISSIQQAILNEKITIQVSDGKIKATVTSTH